MAKLFLKFDAAVLKEVPLTQGVVTIGRLPDNVIQIDNLAVSGHHAKIYWDQDHYIIEDNNSLNGTFVNNRRVSRAALKDGDSILVGKHTLDFKDAWHDDNKEKVPPPQVKQVEATMVLDTKAMRDLMSKQAGAAAGAGAAAAPAAEGAPAKERAGMLTVLDGKTDHSTYMLQGKMNMIGKADEASIKLKGFFAPKVAALITKRDTRFLIAATEKNIHVKINGAEISGQKELQDGDIIEVASVKFTFTFAD